MNHRGNSNTKQRIALIKRFVSQFGFSNILELLADREFVGQNWFKWLESENIPFFIRTKQDAISTNARGLEVDIAGLFYGMKKDEKRTLEGKRLIHKNQLYLSGTLGEKGELVIIVSNRATDKAVETYYHHWEIENLFQCLKNRGFKFADTHMTKSIKIKLFITIINIKFKKYKNML